MSASANLCEVLGVQAQVGRGMMAADDAPGAPHVAVLTDGLWHRRFGGGVNALGQTLVLNNVPVMPLHEQVVGNVRPPVLLPQVAVALLLLTAHERGAHLLGGQATWPAPGCCW